MAAAGCSFVGDEKSQLEILMKGNDLSKYFMNEDAEALGDDLGDDEDDEKDGEDADTKASAAFCNQWLDVVGLAVTGRLLERTMRKLLVLFYSFDVVL